MLARVSACAICWNPSKAIAVDSRDSNSGLMRPVGKALKEFNELACLSGAESPAEPKLCERNDLKVGE